MNGVFERGEVYWVNLGSGFKNEKGVFRPGVVVADERYTKGVDCVMVALTTTKYKDIDCMVKIGVCGRPTYVMLNEVNTYDKERFGDYIGRLSNEELRAVEDVLEMVFELGYKDDDEITEKDRQIEARDATIAELQAKLAEYDGANADEVSRLSVELAVTQKLYNTAIEELAKLKFANDLAAKKPAEIIPVVAEVSETTAMPQDCRLDINHCTGYQLKKLGFDPEIADRIVRARPFGSVEDLKGVYGVTSNMYRLKSPMLFCTPFAPKVLEMTAPDAVNINQCAGKDLVAIGMDKNAAYKITSHRKRNGFYTSVSDLQSVPGVSKKCYHEFASRLAV